MGRIFFAGGEDKVEAPSEIKAYWKLDETTGDANDRFATYTFSENGTVPSAAGKRGYCRGAYTTANYFTWNAGGSDATVFDANLFLIEFWIKTPGGTPAVSEENIWNKGTFLVNGKAVGITTADTLTLSMEGLALLGASTSITDDAWHYCVLGQRAAAGADECRIYIDGVQDAAQAGGTMGVENANMCLGIKNTLGANTQCLGVLDEVAFWDLTGTSKSWADLETYISRRVNGATYAV